MSSDVTKINAKAIIEQIEILEKVHTIYIFYEYVQILEGILVARLLH